MPADDFDWSYAVLIDDLLAVAQATGAARFHLAGESIGGTAALAFALKVPDKLLSLCLSNAAARDGVRTFEAWFAAVARLR